MKVDHSSIRRTLRQMRKEHKLTLSKVSVATGISVGFLSDIERERTMPSVETLFKLLEHYGFELHVTD